MSVVRVVLCLCVCICMLESVYGRYETLNDEAMWMKMFRGDSSSYKFDAIDDDDMSSNSVNLTLYYETLCPACRDFFASQLAPVVEQLRTYLNVELIPYGNARTYEQDGKYAFRCQHGKRECYGNKLQACVIDNIQDSYDSIMFNACLMRLGPTEVALAHCGQSLKKKSSVITSITECAKEDRGAQLLKTYGDKTKAVNLKFVPLIIINDSRAHDEEASSNLFDVVCKLLPKPPQICNSAYNVS